MKPSRLKVWTLAVTCATLLVACGGDTAESRVGVIQLPRTGQSRAFSAGDDGSLRRGLEWPEPRFTNPDASVPVTGEVILDRLTGLSWSRNTHSPGPGACNPGQDMNWTTAHSFVRCLNANSFAGYSDWRLPNIKELRSIANSGKADWPDWMTSLGFENTRQTYWSSSSDVSYQSYGLIWTLWIGFTNGSSARAMHSVWPVRGVSSMVPKTGQLLSIEAGDDGDLRNGVEWPIPRFTNPDGTVPITEDVVLDNLTGLVWTRDMNTPGPEICNPGVKKSWWVALDYIDCLNENKYLGHSDWSMPNINELESLVNVGEAFQARWLKREGFRNLQEARYWSSTTHDDIYGIYAWGTGSMDGRSTRMEKYDKFSIWPMR